MKFASMIDRLAYIQRRLILVKRTIVVEKKTRIRKALTVREQAELARANTQSSRALSTLSGDRSPLSKLSVIRAIFVSPTRPFTWALRPLKPLLRPLRWVVPVYFINAWHEFMQVSWPSRRETRRLTIAVFIFAVVFGLLIAGVDKVLDALFKKVILQQ